jgi:membrane protein
VAFATNHFNIDRFPWAQRVRRTYVWRLARASVGDFFVDDCPTRASVIAFATLFSLFPLILLLLTVVGYLVADSTTKAHLVFDVSTLFPGSSLLIQQTLDTVGQKHGSTTIFATLTLFWSASGAFNALNYNVNAIWRVPKERGFVESWLLALFMVVVVALVFLVSLAFTTLLGLVALAPPANPGPSAPLVATSSSPIVALLLPLVVTTVLFTLVYRFIPNLWVSWASAVRGGVAAGLLFEIGKQIFAFYLTSFAQFDAVYGSIGAVIALLTWAYYSSIILLFGCEVSHSAAALVAAHSHPQDARTTTGTP